MPIFRSNPTSLPLIVFPSAQVRTKIHKYIVKGNIPNMILYGPPGTGKSTLVASIPSMLGAAPGSVTLLNGSSDNSVDFLEKLASKLKHGIPCHSHDFDKRVVIWDEVDLLSKQTIERLKGVMDEREKDAVFLFTTNHYDLIKKKDSGFVDRCVSIDFSLPDPQEFAACVKRMVNASGESYTSIDIEHIIESSYPSIRAAKIQLI